jgi:hypothetical protein
MALPRARSVAEAQLYIGLLPCVCGESGLSADREVLSYTPPVIVRYLGVCLGCGRNREFVLEMAEVPAQDDRPVRFGAGPEPSTLVDAGGWLLVAQQMAEGADELVRPGRLTGTDIRIAYDLLRATAAAVDEILKFLPPDADAVPDEAFWTDAGRAVRRAAPDRFARDYLSLLQLQRWNAVDDFEDEYDVEESDMSGSA